MKGKLFGHSKKVVGKFKGLIRIMLTEDEEPMFNEEMMEQLLKPKPYTVRLYLLRATNLTGSETRSTSRTGQAQLVSRAAVTCSSCK